MDLITSASVIKGLEQIEALPLSLRKKIVVNSIEQAVSTKPNLPFKSDLYSNCPENIKRIEFCVLSVLINATRKNVAPAELNAHLMSKGLDKQTTDLLENFYSLYRDDLELKCSNFTTSIPATWSDVRWSILCEFEGEKKSSQKPGELLYKLQIVGDSDSNCLAQFVCTSEELQSLISQLKDIHRHCQQIALPKKKIKISDDVSPSNHMKLIS